MSPLYTFRLQVFKKIFSTNFRESKTLFQQPCEYAGCNETKVQAHHHAGYEQENWLNVQWLCRNHHKENAIYLFAFGELKALTEWSEIYKLSPMTIRQRLSIGFSPEKALTAKKNYHRK